MWGFAMKKQHDICTIDGCGRKHKSRGYCASHYQQYKRGLTDLGALKTRQRVKPDCCVEVDCESSVKANGLCAAHYQRFLRHGHTRYRDRKRPAQQCSVGDCDNILYANTLCHQHYMRERKIKKMGLSTDSYLEMFGKQKGLCAICFGTETSKDGASGKFRALAIDHNHETGAVRGLLCSPCNRAIGLLKDDPATLRNAADYLERYTSAPGKNRA
jgi:hypothetical protein